MTEEQMELEERKVEALENIANELFLIHEDLSSIGNKYLNEVATSLYEFVHGRIRVARQTEESKASKYTKKMKEAAERPDLHSLEYGTIFEAATRFSMSTGSIKKIAKEAGAIRRLGRITRYDMKKISEYIDGKNHGR